jgi:hypothetical protein
MAKTYVDVTTGSNPVQFQFILTETGKGEPVAPESEDFQVNPPLIERTARGDFFVQLDWNPTPIQSGSNTTFTIDFLDKDQFPTSTVSYNLKIVDSNDTSLLDLKNQLARDGTANHQITFENPGLATVEVLVTSVKGIGTGGFVEKTDFTLKVD